MGLVCLGWINMWLSHVPNHCPFFVKCFGGWEKGKPGEARGEGGQHGEDGRGGEVSTSEGGTGEEGPDGGGPARVGKDRVRGSSTGALCTGLTLICFSLFNSHFPCQQNVLNCSFSCLHIPPFPSFCLFTGSPHSSCSHLKALKVPKQRNVRSQCVLNYHVSAT
jgi:hypothetical protein